MPCGRFRPASTDIECKAVQRIGMLIYLHAWIYYLQITLVRKQCFKSLESL